MIEFKSLEFKGAATFSPKKWTKINLYDQGVITVFGKNLDSGGSNEAGKSALFYPIPNILYSTTPGGLSKKRKSITTSSYKGRLVFSIDDNQYKIEQAIGKKSYYKILENDRDITPKGGINNCENLIKEIFPLSEEEYYSFVHVAPHKFHTLAKGKLAERLAFIHSVFSLNEYDIIYDKVKL